MNENTPAKDPPDPARRRVVDLRDALLRLHKVLIESERIEYERVFGSVQSPADFLQLLIRDPWFAWLRPISELIVLIDETLDAKEPITPAAAEGFMKNARALLRPAEQEQLFSKHYFEAMQRDPDVVLAHADTLRLAEPPRHGNGR